MRDADPDADAIAATKAIRDDAEQEQVEVADQVPIDLSLGEDWHDDGRSQDYVELDPISAEAYFDLTDEEKREVARDAHGRPYGYWSWSKEAWNRYGRENPPRPTPGRRASGLR